MTDGFAALCVIRSAVGKYRFLHTVHELLCFALASTACCEPASGFWCKLLPVMNKFPDIPPKLYFTIGEVGELCDVKPHVLRYWEREFSQLNPVKRRGNRRYYQKHEVIIVRRIRQLLYDQGFTISGARNRLQEMTDDELEQLDAAALTLPQMEAEATVTELSEGFGLRELRQELYEIRDMLTR